MLMKKKRNLLPLLLSAAMLLLAPSTALGAPYEEEDSDQTLAPYFFVEDGDPDTDSFPLKETKVSVTINGSIAETYVTQTYTNEGQRAIHANYVFPASTKVAVHGMKMEIGDQVITAKIKEKEEAKEEFEEAKEEGKSASLLEQQRANVFTMDVANVMPGDSIRIQLHYTELITATEGTYQFVFPTVTGPRYPSSSEDDARGNLWAAAPYLMEGDTPPGTYDIQVDISGGVPVSHIESSSHQIQVTPHGDSTTRVTLSNPENFAGDRDFILNYQLTGDAVDCGLTLHEGKEAGEENFFMLMVQPPNRYEPEDILPRDYVFVIDISGSMSGYPLDTAKTLIQSLVSSLNSNDSFNLVLFSNEATLMSDAPLAATQPNIEQALDFIDQLEGGGGTELAPALQLAVNTPNPDHKTRSIVTLTDGYLLGEREIFELIEDNLNRANFFSFGIGTSVNRYLIEGMAKTGGGEAFVATNSQEAEEEAKLFQKYIQAPILTDLQVNYGEFQVYDVEPSLVSTLYAERPIVLFGKWKGQPSGTITITGKSGNQDYSTEILVNQVAPSDANHAIPYLWARTRVEQLTDYGSYEELTPEVKAEVTQLGLNYSMLTPYTSFIAVTDTIRNQTGEGTDVNQPLPLPSQVSNLAVGYTSGSEPGTIFLLFAAAALVIFGVSRQRKKERQLR